MFRAPTVTGIFAAIEEPFSRSNIPLAKCISSSIDNTSVNVKTNIFIINEARKKNDIIVIMDCLCHMAHNTAAKEKKELVKVCWWF